MVLGIKGSGDINMGIILYTGDFNGIVRKFINRLQWKDVIKNYISKVICYVSSYLLWFQDSRVDL